MERESCYEYPPPLPSGHTFKDNCPECAKLEAAKLLEKMSPEDRENAELVEALMVQWDSMITNVGNRLVERLRQSGHDKLKAFKARYIEAPKASPK